MFWNISTVGCFTIDFNNINRKNYVRRRCLRFWKETQKASSMRSFRYSSLGQGKLPGDSTSFPEGSGRAGTPVEGIEWRRAGATVGRGDLARRPTLSPETSYFHQGLLSNRPLSLQKRALQLREKGVELQINMRNILPQLFFFNSFFEGKTKWHTWFRVLRWWEGDTHGAFRTVQAIINEFNFMNNFSAETCYLEMVICLGQKCPNALT